MNKSVADWLLSSIVILNVALLALLFVPSFSGIGAAPGLADRLWGNVRVGGWRADIVWVLGSSVAIALGAFAPVGKRGLARSTVILCRVWLPLFVVYAGYALMRMFG